MLADVRHTDTGAAIPADSDFADSGHEQRQADVAQADGEFRAAMNVELKRGRGAVTRFLDPRYGDSRWTRAAVHDWLRAIRPPYVVDVNRDTQPAKTATPTPRTPLDCRRGPRHGDGTRYRLFAWDGEKIHPHQRPGPLANPSCSSRWARRAPAAPAISPGRRLCGLHHRADGRLCHPAHLKTLRQGKRYLLMGLRLNRDTERMVMADIIYAAHTRRAGC